MTATKGGKDPEEDKKSRHLDAIWFGNGYQTKARAYGEALKVGNIAN